MKHTTTTKTLSVAAALGCSAAISNAALLAHYTLETDLTNSVAGPDATALIGAPTFGTAGVVGNGVVLDGGTAAAGADAINVPISSATLGAGDGFTIQAWYKLDDPPSANSDGSGRQFVFESNDSLDGDSWAVSYNATATRGQTFTRDSGQTFTEGASVDQWRLVTITYEGDAFADGSDGSEYTVTTYIDGVMVGTTQSQGSDFIAFESINFGAHRADDRAFDGMLDEIKIWDNVLTASEVRAEFVPEPSSAALLGLGGLALILRRRK